MDDDYGADDALLEAMAAVESAHPARSSVKQPAPQPKPQVIQQKTLGSGILVSPRQRGNPLLTSIRSIPWEYSDIPADYVLGLTTCALFLSLKYHRLHPEYIYTRIRNLQGKYNLRILLTLVDIPNHEDSLRELSKTSVVNNVTVILCWSAAEAARYLELYKSYENANFSAIRGQQSSNYADKLVEFVTVPRSLNKSDAVALVANFGSLKNAINAEPEQLSMISGWGGAKVKRWTSAVEEPFRARKAAKRGFQSSSSAAAAGHAEKSGSGPPTKVTSHASSSKYGSPGGSAPGRQSGSTQPPAQFHFLDEDDDSDEEEAFATMSRGEEKAPSQPTNQPQEERQPNKESSQLSEGVAAALAKLRQNG
ncbi:binding domain of DNA repair protein ercc1 (rad10/Swi10) domain-containing protein [Trichoderma breve]|uniref:Binding domain of DNA repair protein ercc1 (Rad10/Swi10) domain-containing protein n=1 Tax=Trichoderma breve TaxID=2034170 RepID=A0A9W9E2I8_9HYPO|nr:binding domain of DNA repair protein ercc1 (rad10/Swi10) domain-containing protein [Trichoderma breve]KAJ4855499.1 binding domain of DNA repair protein ercc1 (rad10/Swi10) domain-containing protein [Trichoderma breve]